MSYYNRKISGVYFIGSEKMGKVKIGYSKDIYRRLQSLQIASPFKLEVLGFLENANPKLEKKFHKYFSDLQVSGEWFELKGRLVKIIDQCNLCGKHKRALLASDFWGFSEAMAAQKFARNFIRFYGSVKVFGMIDYSHSTKIVNYDEFCYIISYMIKDFEIGDKIKGFIGDINFVWKGITNKNFMDNLILPLNLKFKVVSDGYELIERD